MTAVQVLGACLALAVVGFDPFGALVLLAATARGAGRRAAVAFTAAGAAVILVTALGLDLLAGAVLPRQAPHVPMAIWAGVEAVAGLGLLLWGVRRYWFPRRQRGGRSGAGTGATGTGPAGRPTGIGARPMAVAGGAYGLTVLGDPGFWGLVALTHRLTEGPAVGIVALWWLLTQSPLVALTLAILVGAGEPVGRWLRSARARLSGMVTRLTTPALLLVGAVLVADAVMWLLTGSFWLG